MRFLLIVSLVFLAGCAPRRAATPAAPTKAECDQIAAQAIQTPSLQAAATLSAQASECYSRAQVRR